jgi:hypothetical protein
MQSSLVTTVQTPRKCSGRRAAHEAREALWVDLLRTGCEQDVRTRVPREPGIPDLIARVAFEVSSLVELRRVDEQGDDDDAALPACRTDQREVALMKGAHRRHQADPGLCAAGP